MNDAKDTNENCTEYTSPDELLKKPSELAEKEVTELPGGLTTDEIEESFSPDLSMDSFKIADKTFQYKMSSIKTQKIMVKSLDVITDLLKSFDVSGMAKDHRDRTSANLKEGIVTDGIGDMLVLVQDIIQRGGISNILITLMDLFVGVVHTICQAQDDSITREWVEENLGGVSAAQEIFFAQLDKDSIGGRVIDFLQIATRAVVG